MIYNIFYSWQSDLPNSKNRSFIVTSIKKAKKLIKSRESRRKDMVSHNKLTLQLIQRDIKILSFHPSK